MGVLSGSLFVVLVMSFLSSYGEANRFYVGGKDGAWLLNPPENYNHWAQRTRFQVNDTLNFKYKNGSDSVLVVTKDDYSSCKTSNPVLSLTDGDSIFTFDRSGPFFFISGNADNCNKGQKLTIVVLAVRPKPQPQSPPPSPSPSSGPAPPVVSHSPAPATLPPSLSPPTTASPPAGSPAGSGQAPSYLDTPSPQPSPSPSSAPAPPVVSPSPAPATQPPSLSPPTTASPPAGSPGSGQAPSDFDTPSPAPVARVKSSASRVVGFGWWVLVFSVGLVVGF